MYYIYKFTNKTNGKIYIGQTKDVQKRQSGHRSEAFNERARGYHLPFHAAIRKYGWDNFNFDILEEICEGESQEYIDERESFFIQHYHSLKDDNGYNITLGGQGQRRKPFTYEEKLKLSKLFSPDEIIDIQQRLMRDEEYDDIEKLYAPKLKRSFLVNINTGANYFNEQFDYPLKKNSKSRFSQKEIREIKDRIKSGEKYQTIQQDFNIKSPGFLSMINSGKYFYSDADKYPLCDKSGNKAQNNIWIQGIIDDILTTNLSLKAIAQKWNKSYATVKNINSGRSHRNEKYKYPLRDNK